VLGDAPAMAMGTIYQALAQSIAISFQNATYAQQQSNITAQAATNQGVVVLYTVSAMAGAVSAAKLAGSDVPDNMLSLLAALRAGTGPIPT
jgi:hypothetical protein